MTVKAFAGEPETLYEVLNYAYHGGVAVAMAPAPKQRGENAVIEKARTRRYLRSALPMVVPRESD